MSYRIEWFAGPAFLGAVLFLFLVPGLALIAVALFALAVVVALAASIVVLPYLLVRTVRRHARPVARAIADFVLPNPVPARRAH